MIYTQTYEHPELGKMILAANDIGLVGLWFDGQKYFMRGINESTQEDSSNPILKRAINWLEHYFASDPLPITELKLLPRGTEFQLLVWAELLKIPYGNLSSYGQIAHEIAKLRGKDRMSARAVGRAVSYNPISIIIPCHRVVGTHGQITGYAGGLDRKAWLLKHENPDV